MIVRALRVSGWVAAGFVLVACVGVGIGVTQGHGARAQDTGGSFGGGDFGGGGGGSDFGGGGGGSDFGGGGGGGGSDWGSGSSSSSDFGGSSHGSGSGSGSYHGGAGCNGADPWIFFLILLIVLVVAAVPMIRRYRESVPKWPTDTVTDFITPVRRIDVSALLIAIDWRARPFVQKRLEELARTGDPSTPAGRRALLHETITLLRRAELAWVYVGVLSSRPIDPAAAEQLFRQTAGDLRARFKAELIRRDDAGVVTRETPESRARANEGEGLVVVSVVLAAHVEIPDVAVATDRDQLDRLVQSIGAMSVRDLAALEVIWSPAAENDRMSSAELETLYRELRRLPGVENVGKVFCTYCSGPFARELPRCPHCGAPSAEATRA